ncbi:transposable element Tcb2 transposase [Trichonephila clavipes]|nr:transposable element Tcb2 transposase [Trichonephila clavipes]
MYSVYKSPHSKYPSLTRIHMFCENLDFSLTDQQLPMFLRLLNLCIALHNGSNFTSQENKKNQEDCSETRILSSDDELAKLNRRVTSTRVTSMVTASIGKAISAATVRRRLHMNGLYARVPRVCVPLSVQSRGARLKWCREHGNWTVSNWGNVMFNDESSIVLKPVDKHIRICHNQGTRNQPQNITEHHAFRGGSIMAWAGISLGYRTDLHIFKRGSVTAVWYRDEVLEPIVRLYAAAVGPTFVLMDDNARPHRADIVDDYLESEGIACMAWPAYSLDLNPTENRWDALGRAVSSRSPPLATLIELETALQEEWRLLNSAVVDHLIESMDASWGSWAWSFVPDVGVLWNSSSTEEELEESNMLKSKKIFQFGIYIGKSSCVLKDLRFENFCGSMAGSRIEINVLLKVKSS